jgi:hypothetical protein
VSERHEHAAHQQGEPQNCFPGERAALLPPLLLPPPPLLLLLLLEKAHAKGHALQTLHSTISLRNFNLKMAIKGSRPATRPARVPSHPVSVSSGIVGKSSFRVSANGFSIPASNVQWNGNHFTGTGTLNGQTFTASGTANGNQLTGKLCADCFPRAL